LTATGLRSREELAAALAKARVLAGQALTRTPGWGPVIVIARQLAAVDAWTADGGTPDSEQRRRLSIGLIAARELPPGNPLAPLCHRIQHFVQASPLAPGA
jgi:hypothetical protein